MPKAKSIITEYAWIPVLYLAVYIAIPTSMYYTDGLDFAFFLERDEFGAEGIHPHHPLFLPVMRFLYNIILALQINITGMKFLQIISSISSAFGIWFFMRLLVSWGQAKSSAAIGGLLLGSVFAYWHFSTDASSYLPAFAIMMFGMLVVFSSDIFTIKRACLSGLILAFAVMVHEIAIFGVIVICFYLFFNPDKKRFPIRESLRFAGILISVIALIMTVSYFALNSLNTQTSPGLWQYLTSHTQVRYFWAVLNVPLKELFHEVAHSQTHLFFHLTPHEWVHFHNSRVDTPATINFYKAFSLICGIILLASLVSFIGMTKEKRHLLQTHYLWLILVFVFTTLFMPENYFYRIFYLPPLIVICGEFLKICFRRINFAIKPITVIAVIAYFIYTLITGILLDHPKQANPFYFDANRIDRFSGTNTLIVFPSENRYRSKYYRYFGKNDCIRITQRVAYMDYWTDIWPNRDIFSIQTEEFIKSNYDNFLVSKRAFAQGEEYLLFSTYNFPGKHPDIMMISKENLIGTGETMGNDGYYLRMRIKRENINER